MKEGMGSEPTGPEKLILAVMGVSWRVGREGKALDVLDKYRLTKSRDRRWQWYFFRVPRTRDPHDASTIGAMIFCLLSIKTRPEVMASRYRRLIGLLIFATVFVCRR